MHLGLINQIYNCVYNRAQKKLAIILSADGPIVEFMQWTRWQLKQTKNYVWDLSFSHFHDCNNSSVFVHLC